MNRPNNLKNIFKKIFGSENQTFRGSHIADGFTSYVSGFDNLKKVVNDSMGVHIEVDRIHNAIYPPITVPSNKPGYYSFSDEYFEFDFNDSQLKSDLTEYFLKKNYSNKIFSGTYDLGMFFQSLGRELLVGGATYYAVSWEKVTSNSAEYEFPTDFNFLHPSTVSISGDRNKDFIIKQRYPIWTIITDQFDGVFNRNVKSQDAFYLQYPFSKDSPVKNSLKLIPAIQKFYKFGLDQGEGSINGKNHSLPVEMARYKTFSEEKRKLDFSRIKIRRKFNYLFEDQKLTSYYDVFIVVRYKLFLNDLRQFMLDEFNKQIMSQVAIRNKLEETPKVKIKDDLFASNQVISSAFEKFNNKEITINEFSNLIKDNLDKTQER
jgi:hypothetical protein